MRKIKIQPEADGKKRLIDVESGISVVLAGSTTFEKSIEILEEEILKTEILSTIF